MRDRTKRTWNWRRGLIVGALSWFAASGLAANEITLEFSDTSRKQVWISSGFPEGVVPDATETEAKTFKLLVGSAPSTDKVFVWDRKTGNMAVKTLQDIVGVWTVKQTDYTLVGLVRVTVQSNGKPVESGTVTLIDSKRSQKQILDSSSKGILGFYGIAPGKVKVVTEYKAEGKTRQPNSITMDIGLKRDIADQTIGVALPEGVLTIKSEEETKSKDSAKGSEKSDEEKPNKDIIVRKANPYLTTLITFIIVGLGAAAIFYAIRYFKNNEARVKHHLEKLGVQIPDPIDPNAAPDPSSRPAAPVAPQPMQQIVLGGADPTPLGTSAVVSPIASTPVVTGVPKLVAQNGTTFELKEGTSTVSREAGSEIVFMGEGSISRRHAEVIRQGSSVIVKDLGSTNGTYVNGVKINGETALEIGDRVQFGAVHLRYEG